MSNEIDDEIDKAAEARMVRIMRHRDGRLAPREAAAVAEEIATDPEAARIAEELAAGDDAARAAWADLESGPVPLALARSVSQAARAGKPRWQSSQWRIAAGLVIGLALGALGIMLLGRGSEDGLRLAGATAPDWKPALMAALDRDPALSRVSFGEDGAGSVAIARWFDTATAMHCAEYTIALGGAADTGGIACRKHGGGWDVIEQDR